MVFRMREWSAYGIRMGKLKDRSMEEWKNVGRGRKLAKITDGTRPSCSFLGAPGGQSAGSIHHDPSTSVMGCARGKRCDGAAGQTPPLE